MRVFGMPILVFARPMGDSGTSMDVFGTPILVFGTPMGDSARPSDVSLTSMHSMRPVP